jgi:hypothetical protein
MDVKKIGDTITEFDGKARIEIGPLRKQAVASKELLSDEVTAAHYKVGGRDALGKPIELGKPMDYIDWKSQERAYTVYELAPVTTTVDGKDKTVTRWLPRGSYPTEAEAMSQAIAIATAA